MDRDYNKIEVLYVPCGRVPETIKIDNSHRAMQHVVGGHIEAYPLSDGAVIICNEEGKINGLPLNRAIYSDDDMAEIIAGDFFVAYAPPYSEDFASLPDKLIEKYREEFEMPYNFPLRHGAEEKEEITDEHNNHSKTR